MLDDKFKKILLIIFKLIFKQKKEPTFADSFYIYFELYYPFKASAPPTISNISLVIAA